MARHLHAFPARKDMAVVIWLKIFWTSCMNRFPVLLPSDLDAAAASLDDRQYVPLIDLSDVSTTHRWLVCALHGRVGS